MMKIRRMPNFRSQSVQHFIAIRRLASWHDATAKDIQIQLHYNLQNVNTETGDNSVLYMSFRICCTDRDSPCTVMSIQKIDLAYVISAGRLSVIIIIIIAKI
jgi:hypothetical protein